MMRWAWLLVVVVVSFTASRAAAQDRIRFFDRGTKKPNVATGAIEDETVARIIYKLGTSGAVREIPGPDVLDVVYEVPGVIKLDYSRAATEERKAFDTAFKESERKKALADALRDHQELLTRLPGERYKFVRRHLQFKVARLLAKQAEEDLSQADEAIAASLRFMNENPDSWQVVQCAWNVAKLQMAKGDAASAGQTYEQLARTPGLPNDIKLESELRIAETLVFSRKFVEAEKRLQSLLRASRGDDAQAARVRVYLAQCLGGSGKLAEAIAELEALINTTADKDLKALAYNVMGDCYRLNGKSREALWPYLWVDVVYHQDKQQHLKAMEQLAKLFEEQGDKVRSQQYRERLQREER